MLMCQGLILRSSCNGWDLSVHEARFSKSQRERRQLEHGNWRFPCGLRSGNEMSVEIEPHTTNAMLTKLVRTMPAVLGYGAGLAVFLGTFDYTGGVLTGYEKDPSVDEYDRKQQLRKNRRIPISETINDLGEGRGESSESIMLSFDGS